VAAPFKEQIRRETLAPVLDAIAARRPDLDPRALADDACAPLDALELKARVAHVADTLARHLGPDVPGNLSDLLDALPPGMSETTGFDANFCWWPVLAYVERHAVEHPDVALPTLREMTKRFSAEFAVRPFLDRDLAGTLAVLETWLDDPDPHVRRLVSEGTRPRLPWAMQVRGLFGAPPPTLGLLDALRRDPEPYVRRSVANHLGDLAKDQPELAVRTATRWVRLDATDEARWIARHGLRHLVKKGHAGALGALGFGPARVRVAAFHVEPAVLHLGGALQISAEIVSDADQDQDLVVDLVLGFRNARGGVSPKTFKWTTPRLARGTAWNGRKALALRPVSTRRHYDGLHTVALQINGELVAEAAFELVV
jgi:3-methyladenine DNA glycosylase AlkC